MEISVVVPTRDRPAALGRCLRALARQDAELEIVVVDDGSRAADAVEAAARSVEARLLRTGARGPAAARNAGAEAATGDVVCFTDDDCEPVRPWAHGLASAAHAGGAAGGRTIPPPGANSAVRASQAIVEHLQLSEARGAAAFAPSCNLAVRRDVLAKVPFDEGFAAAAGEDRDWSARAAAVAAPPVYVPEAVVVHHQALTAGGLMRQQYRYGRGASRFRRLDRSRRLSPARFYVQLLGRALGDGPAVGALVAASQAAVAAGVLAERLSRR